MNPPESARVYLRAQAKLPERRPPGFLARLFGLDVYSSRLLTKRTRVEMNLAARMLLLVILFELTAWTFLFNTIFSSDIFHRGWSTGAAVALATLFAAMIYWFERNVLTADGMTPKEESKAKGVRIFFILVAAFLTAQPVELLFFREPILKRIHAEGIRRDAVMKLRLLEGVEEYEAQIIKQMSGDTVPTTDQAKNESYIEVVNLEEAQRNLDAARESRLQSDTEYRKATSNEEYWSKVARERLVTLNATKIILNSLDRDTQEVEYLAAAAENRNALRLWELASNEVTAARKRVHQYEAEVAATQLLIKDCERVVGELTDKVIKRRSDKQIENAQALTRIKESREQMVRWIEKLVESEPGVPIDGDEAVDGPLGLFSYSDPEYDFFEQIGVIWDMAFSRSLRWPIGADSKVDRLREEFGMGSQFEHRDGSVYLMSVITVHLAAMFVPFLIFTIKWYLMPKTLKNYYSEKHQSMAGDLDAMLSVSVETQVTDSADAHSKDK